MLNASEIAELEKKVFHYRMKKYLRYGIVILLLLSLFGISFSFYLIKQEPLLSVQDDSMVPKQQSSHIQEPPLLPVQMNPSSAQGFFEETLLLKSPNILAEKMPLKKELPLPIEEEILTKTTPSNIASQETTFYRNTDESIDTSVLAPPLLEDIKQKGMVKIESQEINSVHYLKEKFEKTNNIIFALMLAEEYYLSKDYVQSNKWALIANQLDADNEKSWLWFAKSKVKLGQKEDAIVALKAYIKNNKSKAAQTLLNQIHLGEIHEQ